MRHRAPRPVPSLWRPRPSKTARRRGRHALDRDRRLLTGAVSSGLVLAAGVMVSAAEVPHDYPSAVGDGDAARDGRCASACPSRAMIV